MNHGFQIHILHSQLQSAQQALYHISKDWHYRNENSQTTVSRIDQKNIRKALLAFCTHGFVYDKRYHLKIASPAFFFYKKKLLETPREPHLKCSLANPHHNTASVHLSEAMTGKIKRREEHSPPRRQHLGFQGWSEAAQKQQARN